MSSSVSVNAPFASQALSTLAAIMLHHRHDLRAAHPRRVGQAVKPPLRVFVLHVHGLNDDGLATHRMIRHYHAGRMGHKHLRAGLTYQIAAPALNRAAVLSGLVILSISPLAPMPLILIGH